MRCYRGCGPFFSPTSMRDEISFKEKDDAALKGSEAIFKVPVGPAKKAKPKPVRKESKEKNGGPSDEDALDQWIKKLSLKPAKDGDAEKIEQMKKDLKEKTFDTDDIVFKLIKRYTFDKFHASPKKEKGNKLKDVKKKTDPSPVAPVVVPPPSPGSSASSGYSTGSSLGSDSPSPLSPSISDINTETIVGDEERDMSVPIALGLIKESKEDQDKRKQKQMDEKKKKHVTFSPDTKTQEKKKKVQAAGGGQRRRFINSITFEAGLPLRIDANKEIVATYFNAEYVTGGGKRPEPGREIEVMALVWAMAEIEEQMKLSDDKKKVRETQFVEDEEEGDEEDEDKAETDVGNDEDTGQEEEADKSV